MCLSKSRWSSSRGKSVWQKVIGVSLMCKILLTGGLGPECRFAAIVANIRADEWLLRQTLLELPVSLSIATICADSMIIMGGGTLWFRFTFAPICLIRLRAHGINPAKEVRLWFLLHSLLHRLAQPLLLPVLAVLLFLSPRVPSALLSPRSSPLMSHCI